MDDLRSLAAARLPLASAVLGPAGLVGTGGVHLFLYLSRGYRDIPKIGPLFLATAVAAFVLAAALALTRTLALGVVAGGFMLAVFGGYLLSATVGILGFQETGETMAAALAGVSELGGTLAVLAGIAVRTPRPGNLTK